MPAPTIATLLMTYDTMALIVLNKIIA